MSDKETVEQLRAELAQAHIELRQVKKLWLNRAGATQLRNELKDLRGANRALGQQLADLTDNRDYWYDKALEAEAERDEARKEAQEQSDEVQEHWLSPAEAVGLQRQLAQAVVAQADAELAAHVHDKACCELAQTVRTERALRREQKRILNSKRQLLREMAQRATRAEALAGLVTPGLERLLVRLSSAWIPLKDQMKVRALAAQIREALDEH